MKRLLLFELLLLILATTFESDSPPGWFQQIIPRTDVTIQDIFFLDSLNGYTVTRKNTNDSSFIFKTTDGGSNWSTSLGENIYLTSLQFTDNNTGYSVGSAPGGIIKKTTNSGLNWFTVNILAAYPLTDLNFINNNTGWVCSDDPISGGIFKTTDGGFNWQPQLGAGFLIRKMFFINNDTGWAGSNEPNGRLYRTTNSGVNWNLQYTINGPFESIFFINGNNGWIRAGTTNSIQYTTDGGFNWTNAQGGIITGYDTKFINDSIGYSGTFSSFKICKSTDGGKTWGYQNTPILSANLVAILKADTSNAWAGQIMHTEDGGGLINYTGIQQISDEVPNGYELYQNYPNPFNPTTNIKYQIVNSSFVRLVVFDVQGKEITALVNEVQKPGTYLADWNAAGYSSGVYFYSLIIEGKLTDTKRMVLVK